MEFVNKTEYNISLSIVGFVQINNVGFSDTVD